MNEEKKVPFRLPGLPSVILSAKGFFLAPAPIRAPPRLVPSLAKMIHLLVRDLLPRLKTRFCA